MVSRRILHVAILMLCCCLSLPAQVVTGSIVGTVKDQSGAVVPNAKVTVTNTDTNAVVRTLTTSDKGEYSAASLQIGHYSITAEAANFKKAVISNIDLHVNEKLTFDPKMTVGSSTDTVDVAAEALQVELQSATASGLITGTQVRELALNGRNWEQLLVLVPGVSDAGNFDQIYVGALAPQGTSLTAFSVNGARREQSNYMIDGADNVDRGSNLTLLAFPNVDAISEFKVIRGQYDPELGRAGGGQINVITKSGTSAFHGNVYEFARNDAFNANNYFNKRTQLTNGTTNRPPILRYHNFGGTIGGPVWIPKIYEQKDKTFFFFSEEVRRNIVYTNAHAEVPTSAMMGGTFRVPVCVAFNVSNQCTATSTTIAPGTFDPIAKAYMTDIFSKYPQPNAAVASDPFGNNSTLRGLFNFREEIYKIDHHFNNKFSINGKILRDSIPTREPGGLFTNIALDNVGNTDTNSPGKNYTLRATIAPNQSWLIEPGYTYSYGAILSDPAGLMNTGNAPNIVAATAGKLPFATTLGRVPSLSMTGGTAPATFGPYRDFNVNHQFMANVTKIWGSHSIKFGGTWYKYRKNENNGNGNQAQYAFNTNGLPTTAAVSATNPTPCVGTAGAAGSTCAFSFEQSWANFLLGRVGTFTQNFLDLTADIRANQFEYYVQDAWRARKNVTISYGIRHSLFRQPTDALGLLGNFDPSTYNPAKAPCILANGSNDVTKNNATGVFTSACNPNYDPLNGYVFAHPPAGVTGHLSPYGEKLGPEYNAAIAPRVGVAWDPWGDGKTAVRSGFGMFYDSATIYGNAENDIFLGSGFQNALSFTNVTTANATGGAAVPANGIPQAITQAQSRIDPNYHPSYTEQWSLDLQRDLANGFILDVGYYGNSGIRLPGFIDINQPAENSYLACTAATPCKGGPLGANVISFGAAPVVTAANTSLLNALRPYVGYSGAPAVRGVYTSNYHGLQTQLQKKFSRNTMFNIAYTWSHSLTTYQADRTTGAIMPIQGHIRDNNYGPGIGDRRHVWTSNFVWDIPWLIEQKGFVGHVLGGWEFSGIQTFQTGLPATVSSNQAVDPTGGDCLGPSPCLFRANQVGDPNSGGAHTYDSGWFNAAAFTNPVAGQTTIPSERPGNVRLPGFWRIDMGMFKNIKFSERFGGQFRAEAYNALNHTNPICCSSFATNSASYNLVRSTRDPRTMQLGLKLSF
ncbi:MAG: TonB-dependent receptor [Acidobacteriales bacterium]|nr:TonB-dependent receptor [Terriglobales bacterium]